MRDFAIPDSTETEAPAAGTGLRMRVAHLLAAVGGALLAWLALTYAVSCATLYFGLGVSALTAPVCLLAMPLAAYAIVAGDGVRRVWLTMLACVLASALIGGAGWQASRAYDHSWDGASYHQEAIIQMAEAWADFPAPLPTTVRYGDWIDTYAKGPWVIAASLYKATGSLESALLMQGVFACIGLLLLASALLRCAAFPVWAVPLLALPAAFNPVTIYQSLSFYIDGQMTSLLVALVGVGLWLLTAPRRWQLVLVAALIVLAINVKQTGIAFAGLLLLAVLFCLWRLRREWFRRTFIACAIGGVLGGLAFGYSPYVLNTLKHGHPFYPILGNGDFDIAQGQRPPGFDERNRFSRLLVSSFSAPTLAKQAAAEWRLPFAWRADDAARYRGADVRIGGWGIWFSGALVLAVVGLLGLRRVAGAPRIVGGAVLVALLAATAINPEAWWARYHPLWFFVPVVIAGMLLCAHQRSARLLGAMVAAVLLANSLLVAAYYYPQQHQLSEFQRQYLAELRAAGYPIVVWFGAFPSNRIRLRDAGIAYYEVNDAARLPCTQPQRIFAHEGLYCMVAR